MMLITEEFTHRTRIKYLPRVRNCADDWDTSSKAHHVWKYTCCYFGAIII